MHRTRRERVSKLKGTLVHIIISYFFGHLVQFSSHFSKTQGWGSPSKFNICNCFDRFVHRTRWERGAQLKRTLNRSIVSYISCHLHIHFHGHFYLHRLVTDTITQTEKVTDTSRTQSRALRKSRTGHGQVRGHCHRQGRSHGHCHGLGQSHGLVTDTVTDTLKVTDRSRIGHGHGNGHGQVTD